MYIRCMETIGWAKVKKVAPEPKFAELKSVIDMETLQAVITHRYDVMAKYTKSLRRTWSEEVANLREKAQFEADRLKLTKKLLQREPTKLQAPQQQQLSEVLAHSAALKTMHEMRVELGVIWERSTVSREQLVQQLQDWCTRAEASGIQTLHDFSRRLRTYA